MIQIPSMPEAAVFDALANDRPSIRISNDSPFDNHSPHTVVYRNHTYATAAHLYEAMKFLDARSDIAQMIRECPSVQDVYRLVSQHEQFVRPDWPSRRLHSMEDVLTLKFKQHLDLRKMLLGTGHTTIIYSNADDTFWGLNGRDEGHNNFGKALARVRDKLHEENGGALMGLLLW